MELVGRCRGRIGRTLGDGLPRLAFVLGSGFQDVPGGFEVLRQVEYADLPGFPRAVVPGHPGKLLLARLHGMECLICSGRAHYYEGHSMEAVTFPIRMLAHCGVKELVLTNAAGGINSRYRPGDFMLFSDHINFTGVNPLRGQVLPGTSRFVDLSEAYCPALRAELTAAGRAAGVRLHKGVYIGVSGPSYETPAEIRAFGRLGADAAGMSTIPEVLMARALGLRVAALSCITNRAAGLSPKKLSHEEVLETGRRSAAAALRLFECFARERGMAASSSGKRRGRPQRKNLKIKGRPLRSDPDER